MNILDLLNENKAKNNAEIESIRSAIPQMNENEVAIAKAKIEGLRSANEQFNLTITEIAKNLNNNLNHTALTGANDADFEYRKAQVEYIANGTMAPCLTRAATTVADNAIIVNEHLYNKIITAAKSYGKVSKGAKITHIPGGIKIPRGMNTPTIKWGKDTINLTPEGIKVLSAISFTANSLTLSVGRTELETLMVVIDAYEDKLAELIAQAYAQACDWAEFNGDPKNDQPLGILNDKDITNEVTFTEAQFADYKSHIGVTDVLNEVYRNGVYVMTTSTFNSLKKVQDTISGEYAAYTVNTANGVKDFYGDHEVICVENDILKSWKSCSEGDVFAVYFKLDNYIFNVQKDLILDTYMDKPTRTIVTDAIYYLDGRIEDPNGVLLLKKAA